MDRVDQKLSEASLNVDYAPAIRKACALGKKLLNKYYSLTDSSHVYRIAMGTLAPLFMFSSVLIVFASSSLEPPPQDALF